MNKLKSMIENSNFSIGFRGYTAKEVDEFLDVLLVSVVDLESKNESLKSELAEKDKLIKEKSENTSTEADEDLKAECEKLKAELKKYETLKSEFMSMIVQIRQETSDEMKESQAEASKCREMITEKDAEILSLQSELTTLRETISTFANSFDKVISQGKSIVTSKDDYIHFLQDQIQKAEAEKANTFSEFEECQALSEKVKELLVTPQTSACEESD